MARQRGQAHVALPRIEIDEPKTLRLSLKGRLFHELEAYRAAYREAYGVDVELEALIPHMLQTYIQSDRAFRSWRSARATTAAE